jgi:hypothetical protein
MTASESKELPLATAEERLPVATFKNSLRQWQALWQAQRPAGTEPATPRVVKVVKPRRGRRSPRPR